MELFQRPLDIKVPLYILEFVLLIAGIVLIISSLKIRKKDKATATVNMVIGFFLVLGMAFALFWTNLYLEAHVRTIYFSSLQVLDFL